jgi:hypothetical protein
LSDPDPQVRSRAALDIQAHGTEGLQAVPALLAMFRDPDRLTACRVRGAVTSLGEEVVPLLQRIRQTGPGRLRPAALTALAEIGGEGVLSARDVGSVERLIRVKLLDEEPQPLTACWLYWIAVAGGDQQGIMRMLGLSAPRPVTFALGCEIVDGDAHCRPGDQPGSPYGRVLVTPELDGWTLVAGAWCDPCDAQSGERVLQQCVELSSRYGSAHAYYYGAQGDGSVWLIAENGVVVRRYQEAGEADDWQWTIGDPLECERVWRAEAGLPPTWDNAARDDPVHDEDDEWKWEAFDLAPKVAAALSINPMAIGPTTAMCGTPLTALTPIDADDGMPSGAYAI